MAPNYPLAQDRATVLTVSRRMPAFDLDAWVARSRAVDLSEIDWAAVPRHPVSPDAIRTLRYMQDIESHTIIYTRSLLATRAIDEPEVATFLACWLYEETFHGLALARFLQAAGHPIGDRERPRGSESFPQWLEARMTALLSRVWPDFCAVHMTGGAVNQLATLAGVRRRRTARGVDAAVRESRQRQWRTQWPRSPLSTIGRTRPAPSRVRSVTRSRSSSAACTGAPSAFSRPCSRAPATGRAYCPSPPGKIS